MVQKGLFRHLECWSSTSLFFSAGNVNKTSLFELDFDSIKCFHAWSMFSLLFCIVQVECPKYPGFCITRQKKEYPFVEIFHSPEQVILLSRGIICLCKCDL